MGYTIAITHFVQRSPRGIDAAGAFHTAPTRREQSFPWSRSNALSTAQCARNDRGASPPADTNVIADEVPSIEKPGQQRPDARYIQ